MIDPRERIQQSASGRKGRRLAGALQQWNKRKFAPGGGMQRQTKFGLYIALLRD